MCQDLCRAQRRQKSARLHPHLGSWMGGDLSSEHSPYPLLLCPTCGCTHPPGVLFSSTPLPQVGSPAPLWPRLGSPITRLVELHQTKSVDCVPFMAGPSHVVSQPARETGSQENRFRDLRGFVQITQCVSYRAEGGPRPDFHTRGLYTAP